MSITGELADAAELRNGLVRTATVGGVNAAGGRGPNNSPDAALSFDVAQSWGTVKLAGVVTNVSVGVGDGHIV